MSVQQSKLMEFALYKVETPTLPFMDYGAIIEEVKRIGAKTALEFGPGYSTLALIESGLDRIVTCEHDEEWFGKAKERFEEYPRVSVKRYEDVAPTAQLAGVVTDETFDLCFVDSPKGYNAQPGMPPGGRTIHPGQEDCSRLNTCLAALDRAPIVLLHDATRPLERATLGRLNAMGHKITFIPCRNGMARIERHV